jgi:hypothetical protein
MNQTPLSLPMVWWTKLRSTLPGVDHTAQVAHCVEGGLIGIGWRLDELAPGTSLDVMVATIGAKSEAGWGRTAAQTVHRFGTQAEIGDFVWTRDTSGPLSARSHQRSLPLRHQRGGKSG